MSCIRSVYLRILVFTGLILITNLTVFGQFSMGTITGRVTDSANSVVAGCKIEVRNLDTNFVRQEATDTTGLYTIPSLPPGRYSVTATQSGFKTSSSTIALAVNQTLTTDFHLEVGQLSESVSVSEQPAEIPLDKDSFSISQAISQREIASLPVNGRNFLKLATLGPGAQPGSDIVNGSSNGGTAEYFEATPNHVILSGQSVGRTTFLQDGVSNLNLFTAAANIIPVMDSIQEFSVETNGMSAKFDQPGLINAVSKRGGNALHGVIYDYLQNDKTNARNFFSVGVPPVRFNQFGGNVGGPIVKNKVFFFFDYGGQRQVNYSTMRARIPTALERQGNFSEMLAGVPVSNGTVRKTAIYDPLTYNPVDQSIQAFPGNIIPENRISDFAKRYNSYFPTPTSGILSDGTNYQQNLRQTDNFDQYTGRIDYNISSRDILYGQIQKMNAPNVRPTYTPNLFGTTLQREGTNAVLEENHVFTPSLINIVRFGYNRTVFAKSQLGVGSQDFTGLFGIQNLQPAIEQNSPPTVGISDCCNLGTPYAPQGAHQNRFQFADELNFNMGIHRMYAGVEINRLQFNGNWTLWNAGQFGFNGIYTSNHEPGSDFLLGSGLADYMLGFPNFAQGGSGNTTGAFRATNVATYFQDDMKLTRKLTVNLGIRYDYYGAPADKWGKAAIYDLPSNQTRVGPWQADKKNFAPRVGFAYSLNDRTVIRSGFGIYYTSTPYNVLQFTMAVQPNYNLQAISLDMLNPTPVGNFFPAPTSTAQAPFALDRQWHTPYLMQWNINIERSIGPDLMASIAYVGNGGRHLSIRSNPNQATPDADPLHPTPIQSRRPYPFVGDVLAQYNQGTSSYNGLQTKLQKRFSHGFSVLGSYTFSKAIDIMATDGGYVAIGTSPKLSRAISDFDRPHSFTLSYIWELPFGSGKPFLNRSDWIGKYLVSGWQLNGITQLSSGQPFSVRAEDVSNTGGQHSFYADRVCDGNLPGDQRTLTRWFDTSCFVQPAPGRFGNTGRNVLRMDSVQNFDMSLFKNFPLGESRRLEFRSEFFNIFNHANFRLGEVSVASANYGRVTSATPGRISQFSLKLYF